MMQPPLPRKPSSDRRYAVVLDHLGDPSTPTQLSRRTGLSEDCVRSTLRRLGSSGLVTCVNPKAARLRVFALTARGYQRRKALCGRSAARTTRVFQRLYADVLYPHRRAVIRALSRPMQAAEIKRQAFRNDPSLRMSASNARDVLRYLLARGVVRKLRVPRSAYPRWELTDPGRRLREALLDMGVRRS